MFARSAMSPARTAEPARFDETRRPRLLVVEDEPALLRSMVRLFDPDYDVDEAKDGAEGLELALRVRPDVVLSDQRMPKMTGVELLCEVKRQLPKTIRLLVTGHDDYGPMVDAVNLAEVHHYFEKPFHAQDLRKVADMLVRNAQLEGQREQLLGELSQSVEDLERANRQLLDSEARLTELVEARTRQLQQSNEKLREANEKLREMAVRDGLTGLFNHGYLLEHVELEVARSARYQRIFSVLFLDIDDFKQVNDQHGHQAGDKILRAVAELLRGGVERLRSSDLSARYGGEEFCLILPETPRAGVQLNAERIREAVETMDWSSHTLSPDFKLTVSIGVAAFPEDGSSADEVLRAADDALYQAKRSGKNRVVVAEAR